MSFIAERMNHIDASGTLTFSDKVGKVIWSAP